MAKEIEPVVPSESFPWKMFLILIAGLLVWKNRANFSGVPSEKVCAQTSVFLESNPEWKQELQPDCWSQLLFWPIGNKWTVVVDRPGWMQYCVWQNDQCVETHDAAAASLNLFDLPAKSGVRVRGERGVATFRVMGRNSSRVKTRKMSDSEKRIAEIKQAVREIKELQKRNTKGRKA